jgi:hypothetical protein
MKRIIFLFLLILGVSQWGFPDLPATEEMLLKLSARVLDKGNSKEGYVYSKELRKNDFELRINGTPKPIIEFNAKKRAIDDNRQGRRFALSFDVKEYGKTLSETISYFIRNISTSSDFLLIRTPLHIYKINLSLNQDEIITFIETNLAQDILKRNNDKSGALNALNTLITSLESKLDTNNADIGALRFFINYFDTEWNMYCSRYIFSNLEQFTEIASQFSQENKESEKWLIHFHEKESTPLSARFKRIHAKISNFYPGLSKKVKEKEPLILESLDKIEKALNTAESIQLDDVMNDLLAANLNCNVVFLPTQAEAGSADSIDYGFDKILETISLQTGGVCMAPMNLIDGLSVVKTHIDYYYELIFQFDGVPEDKNIDVKIPSSSGTVFYKNKFKKEEFDWLMSTIQNQNLTISGFSLQNHRLTFSLSGYRSGQVKENRIGIDIRLTDDRQEVIYETANTLKPEGDSLSISVNIPDNHKGYFKLVITANDSATGKTLEFKEYVKL